MYWGSHYHQSNLLLAMSREVFILKFLLTSLSDAAAAALRCSFRCNTWSKWVWSSHHRWSWSVQGFQRTDHRGGNFSGPSPKCATWCFRRVPPVDRRAFVPPFRVARCVSPRYVSPLVPVGLAVYRDDLLTILFAICRERQFYIMLLIIDLKGRVRMIVCVCACRRVILTWTEDIVWTIR